MRTQYLICTAMRYVLDLAFVSAASDVEMCGCESIFPGGPELESVVLLRCMSRNVLVNYFL